MVKRLQRNLLNLKIQKRTFRSYSFIDSRCWICGITSCFSCVCGSEKGEVFVWGYGILGKGPKLSESSTPEMIPSTLFGRSEFNPSVAVSRIRCGLSHFAAVTGENVCLKAAQGRISPLQEIRFQKLLQ